VAHTFHRPYRKKEEYIAHAGNSAPAYANTNTMSTFCPLLHIEGDEGKTLKLEKGNILWRSRWACFSTVSVNHTQITIDPLYPRTMLQPTHIRRPMSTSAYVWFLSGSKKTRRKLLDMSMSTELCWPLQVNTEGKKVCKSGQNLLRGSSMWYCKRPSLAWVVQPCNSIVVADIRTK
jgi:hypothetical protein